MSAQPNTHTRKAVALVARDASRTFAGAADSLRNGDPIQHGFDLRRFMPLTGSYFDRERQASAVSNQMEFAAESASWAAQSMVLWFVEMQLEAFFEAPAAARDARTDEPSIHHKSQSICPCWSKRI